MRNSRYLDEWVGLDEAWARERVGQALFFEGAESTWERLKPRLVRQLLCEATAQADCTCRSCQTPLDRHPDWRRLTPATRVHIDKEQIVEMTEWAETRPLWSPRKLVVIDPADKLSRVAESHLLKHLEEPPAYLVYALWSSTPDQVLPTIHSRCQHWRLAFSPGDRPAGWALNILQQKDQMTLDNVLWAARYARERYRATGRAEWLRFWEALADVHRTLAANGNPDLALGRLYPVWPEGAP
jgi:DNA polymerase-3 subunit delta'